MSGGQTCEDSTTLYCNDVTRCGGGVRLGPFYRPSEHQCADNINRSAGPTLTLGRVVTALREIPVPAAKLKIQPPGGKTLVNFDTNFYTESDDSLRRTVRLLGHRVDFDIWIDTYRWHFGDGTKRETASPGAPYPALKITHNYLAKDTYNPSLDVVYAANFRVDGGPWRPVNGTVTIEGTPTTLRAITATPTLVSP